MKIARDKWKHFYVGIAMGVVLQLAGQLMFPHHPYKVAAAVFGLVCAISYGFELFSLYTGRGHYEFLDAVAAVIGGVLGMAAVMMISGIISDQ
ncbi:MAG TPA: hypothetical protein VHK91_01855 [Flavisolibacter sp.]|jgi:VanZ family protein|nr:hypothetical protein [Flavisolibacter sp.]